MKFNKRKTALLSISLLAIAAGISGAYIYHKTTFGDSIRLSLKNFSEGTQLSYKLIEEGKLLKDGDIRIAEDGHFELSTPKMTDKLDYHFTINESGNEAEMLDLLLNIDKSSGNISLKGEGFEAFSSLDVKNGVDETQLNADGLGFIQADIEGVLGTQIKNAPILEMAFQNAGIESDISALKDRKIEIFLGEDLDYDLADIRTRFGGALNSMATQLSAVMVQQTFIIGGFIDATVQLKTQRKIQQLQARAHKDYHPSDQMCRFGTFIRSVARSERKSEVDKYALNRLLMDKYLGMEHSSTSEGTTTDIMALFGRYVNLNCDPRDNGGSTKALCEDRPDTQDARNQVNKDVDYTKTLAGKLTLDVNFADGFLGGTRNNLTNDEQNIIAMARNLYFPTAFDIPDEAEILNTSLIPQHDARAYAAKMNVAHSSFVNIVGMKSSAPEGKPTVTTETAPPPAPFGTNVPVEAGNYPNTQPVINTPVLLPVLAAPNTRNAPVTTTPPSQNATPTEPAPGSWRVLTEDSGWAYMKALMMEMGVVDENSDGNVHDEIDHILGERPSYYAQMEVLTKKIYQMPGFYTNLYDKPANVARISASIDAITLMNQRDRYESLLRQEMLTSLLVEENLKPHVEDVNSQIYSIMKKDQIRN